MSKINWNTVITAAIVALVVSLLVVYAFNEGVLFSPQFASPLQQTVSAGGGIINAHECTRDGVCEMIGAEITNATIGTADAYIIDSEWIRSDYVVVHNADGAGYAYACLNPSGGIYRSNTSCV